MWHTKEEAESKYTGVKFRGDEFYIGPNVRIGPNAHIEQGVRIERGVHIWPNVRIGQEARIEQGAYIELNAVIRPNVHIGQDVHVGPNVRIRQGSVIVQNARIGRDRTGVTACIYIAGVGPTKRFTAHDSDDGLIIVIGCMNEYRGHNIEDARAEIAKKYDENHEYFAALRLAEKWYENLKNANNKNKT